MHAKQGSRGLDFDGNLSKPLLGQVLIWRCFFYLNFRPVISLRRMLNMTFERVFIICDRIRDGMQVSTTA